MNKTILGTLQVFYPESCPIENVLEHILPYYPCAISPIHNRDKDSKGNLKKPHYHIMFLGKLSEKDKRYISSITTMKFFEPCYDLDGAYFYLYHWTMKTNWFIDGKAQYWSSDIIKSESFDFTPNCNIVQDYFTLMISQLNCYYEFSDFMNYLAIQPDIDYRNYCLKNVTLIHNFISSNRAKLKF